MNPYPGLRPFDGEYAPFFFGRDRQISELIERLQGNRFVAVVGLSGSGKSSVVRAGLLPALRAGQLGYAGSGWRVATLRPSERPIATLAAELSRNEVLGPSAERARLLESSTVGLLEATAAGRPPETNLLVFVDQFEDLFRLVNEGKLDPARAAHFINLLLAVSAEPRLDFPIYVVITLRSEYLGSCARYYGLPEALNRSQYLVPRLTPEQLREAIESPAALTDVEFEPALVQRLQVEASIAPDELPRLQHLLMRLWEHRTEATITLNQYRSAKIGGLEQSLDLHAEEVYGTLTDEQKRIAHRVFQRLTAWDEASRDARRPTALRELAAVSGVPAEAVTEVVRHFREAHFLTEIPGGAPGEPLVDITHESLIRHWKRLEEWAKEEARYKEIFLGLASEKRPLWSEVEVREAIGWRDNLQPDEAWAERYVPGQLGVALEVLKRLELDLSAAARRKKLMLAGSLVVTLLLAGLSGWAFWEEFRAEANAKTANEQRTIAQKSAQVANEQRLKADQQKDIAESGRLSSLALTNIDVHPDLALLLSIEAGRIMYGFEAKDALLSTLAHNSRLLTYFHLGRPNSSAVAISPDGRMVATGEGDGKVWLWRTASPSSPIILTGHGQTIVSGVAFSPDSKTLASEDIGGTVMLWDVRKPLPTGQPLKAIEQGRAIRPSVAFRPDGRMLAATFLEETILWDVDKRQVIGEPLKNGTLSVESVAFSPDGQLLATAGDDKTLLWNVDERSPVGEPLPTPSVTSVAFGDGGKILAAASRLGTVQLWDVSAHRPIGAPLAGDQFEVTSVSFSPSGKRFASGSIDGFVRVRDVDSKRVLIFKCDSASRNGVEQPDYVTGVAFGPEGKTLAAVCHKNVMTWDVEQSHPPGVQPEIAGKGDRWKRAAFSQDSKVVALTYDGIDDRNQGVWLGNLSHPKTLQHFIGQRVSAMAFNPAGKVVVTTAQDGPIGLRDIATKRMVAQIPGIVGTSHDFVAFSREGATVAIVGSDQREQKVDGSPQSLRLWSVLENRPVGELLALGPNHLVSDVVAADPNLQFFAYSWSSHGQFGITVWDATKRRSTCSLIVPNGVKILAFNEDGNTLISVDALFRVSSWDTKTCQLVGEQVVTDMASDWTVFALSPNGKMLATESLGGDVMMWDVDTHRHSTEALKGSAFLDSDLSLSPDGKWLFAAGWLWQLDLESLASRACTIANRNLTSAEWRVHIGTRPYRATCPNLPLERKTD